MKKFILILVIFTSLGWNNLKTESESFYRISEDSTEYITLDFMEGVENSLFFLCKELYCSNDPYAKNLVKKYKMSSNTIKCD